MKKMIVTITVVIGLLLAVYTSALASGPVVTESVSADVNLATSVKEMVGAWERTHAHYIINKGYVQFNRDGTFTCAPFRWDDEEQTDCQGEMWFEGTQLSVQVDVCPADAVGVYQVQRLESGHLKFEMVKEDPCTRRTDFLIGSFSTKDEIEFGAVP